jgi:hypothetical protein
MPLKDSVLAFFIMSFFQGIIPFSLKAFSNTSENSTVVKITSMDMADVPKRLYRRYFEVSEATFQVLLKNHSAGTVRRYKPALNFSSPHKGFEGCLPCLFYIA